MAEQDIESPIEPSILSAVGNLVTAWAAVEMMLSQTVARLAAFEPNFDVEGTEFERGISAQTFVFVLSSSIGSNAKSLLNQIENFMHDKRAEIEPWAKEILKIKSKRDVVAHSAYLTQLDQKVFFGQGASRRKFGTNKPYTADQINEFSYRLRLASFRIDQLVTKRTGKTVEDCQKAAVVWQENLQGSAKGYVKRLVADE